MTPPPQPNLSRKLKLSTGGARSKPSSIFFASPSLATTTGVPPKGREEELGVSELLSGINFNSKGGENGGERDFLLAPVHWLESMIDDLEGFGFLESTILLVREKLYCRLVSNIHQGGTIEELHSQELGSYWKWRSKVLSDRESATRSRSGSGSLYNTPPTSPVSSAAASSPTPARVQLQELFLWYLLYVTMGNLKTLHNFRCYLFHHCLLIQQRQQRLAEGGENLQEEEEETTAGFFSSSSSSSSSSPPSSPGQWAVDQVSLWYEVLRQNSNKRKEGKKPMDRFLNYDDVNLLFTSKSFIRSWNDPTEREKIRTAQTLVGNKYKTYLEKSDQHFFGLVGYLSAFRNYYFYALLHVIQLTVIWTLTMTWWYQKLLIGTGAIFLLLLLKLVLEWWQRPKKIRDYKRPDVRASTSLLHSVLVVNEESSGKRIEESTKLRKQLKSKGMVSLILGVTSLVVVLGLKSGFDWGLFMLAEMASAEVWFNTLEVVVLWILVFCAYFLNTICFYRLHVAFMAWAVGKAKGVGQAQRWSDLWLKMGFLERSFNSKIIASNTPKHRPELSPQEKQVAWAQFWNRCLRELNRSDLLSEAETERLSYGITDNSSFNDDEDEQGIVSARGLFRGKITKRPVFLPKPTVPTAIDRLLDMASGLLMEMPEGKRIGELPSTTAIIQVHNGDMVLYSIEELARLNNTGRTVLAQLSYVHHREWTNFLQRMKFTTRETEVIVSLVHGRKLTWEDYDDVRREGERTLDELLFSIRCWASYRLPSVCRPLKGMMARREAYRFLAKLQYPELNDLDIEAIVSEKLQVIISLQNFDTNVFSGSISGVSSSPKREEDLLAILEAHKYCMNTRGVEVSHVVNDSGLFYAVLLSGPVLEEVHRAWLPGFPVLNEEGESDILSCALAFARGEYIQIVPNNSEAVFEQEIKFPNLLSEFGNDPSLVSLGIKEKVISSDFNNFSHLRALAVKTETAFERVETIYGIRTQKAASSTATSSDVFSARWIEGEGEGVGKQTYISEEVFSSFAIHLNGKATTSSVEYMQEGRFRELGLLHITRTLTKESVGKAQQLYSRWSHWLNNDIDYNNGFHLIDNQAGLTEKFSWQKRLHLAFSLFGDCLQSLFIKYSFLFLVASTILIFKHYPGHIPSSYLALYGVIWGLWLFSFSSPTLLSELVLEKGLTRGSVMYFTYLLPLVVYNIFNFLTTASGFGEGLLCRAKYIATGRLVSLEHLPFRNNYSTFKASHLYYSFILSFVLVGAVFFLKLSQVPYYLLLSAPLFFTMVLWLSFPFITNPGSLPFNTPFKVWLQLLADDWRDFALFSNKIILYNRHILWPAVFAIFVGISTFFAFKIELFWVMLVVGILVGILTPWLRVLYYCIGFTCILLQTAIGFTILPFVALGRLLQKRKMIHLTPWLYDQKYGFFTALQHTNTTVSSVPSSSKLETSTPTSLYAASTSVPTTIPVTQSHSESICVQQRGGTATLTRGGGNQGVEYHHPVERRLRMRLARQNTFGFDRVKPLLVPAPSIINAKPYQLEAVLQGPIFDHIQQMKTEGVLPSASLLPSQSIMNTSVIGLNKPNRLDRSGNLLPIMSKDASSYGSSSNSSVLVPAHLLRRKEKEGLESGGNSEHFSISAAVSPLRRRMRKSQDLIDTSAHPPQELVASGSSGSSLFNSLSASSIGKH
jgi:hypothetical protein